MSCLEENFKSLPFPLWLKEWFIKMLSWELKYFSLRRFFSAVSQCCGKADFPSLASPESTGSVLAVRSCAEPCLDPAQPRASPAALPSPRAALIAAALPCLGLLSPHHFPSWVLPPVDFDLAKYVHVQCVHVFLFCSPNLLYLFNIHWNIPWDIDWEDLVSCLENCKGSTGNKHNILVSFLCELVSPLFFIKIYLCYLLCKISCWVKVFKVWCFPPSQSTPDPWEHFEKIPVSSFQGKAEEIH